MPSGRSPSFYATGLGCSEGSEEGPWEGSSSYSEGEERYSFWEDSAREDGGGGDGVLAADAAAASAACVLQQQKQHAPGSAIISADIEQGGSGLVGNASFSSSAAGSIVVMSGASN